MKGEIPINTGDSYLVVGGCMYSGNAGSGGQHIGFRLNCLVQDEEVVIEDCLLKDGTFTATRIGVGTSAGEVTYKCYRQVYPDRDGRRQ